MQKNSKSVNKKLSPTIQNHRLDRMAKPYLYWLYVFACLPILIMVFLMFVDTEGIRFEGMSLTFNNFTFLSNSSVITAFLNSFKYSILTTLICIFFGYLLLPIAAGFYAALLACEKKDGRILSYVLPLIPLVLGVFILNTFYTLEAISYVVIAWILYIGFDKKHKQKSTCLLAGA